MPADTDHAHLTPGGAAESDPVTGADRARKSGPPAGPVTEPGSKPEGGPVWPVTALLVLLGLGLLGWEVIVAVVNTAPFFGESPSRDRLIETGMLLATSAVPVLLACGLGLLLGSRWGLLLLAVPGAVAVAMGVDLMTRTGDERYADRNRAVTGADPFADLTRPNWLAAVVLLLTLALVLWRRRRQTGIRANDQAGQRAT